MENFPIIFWVSLAACLHVALSQEAASQLPRPVGIRFAGGGSRGMGYLEVGLSDGAWGPVCDLGGFDVNAARLACALLGFDASQDVAKLAASSLSDAQPLTAAPVIAINNCDAFKLSVRSTWNLAIACSYIVRPGIPARCSRREFHVQVSCHGNDGANIVASTPIQNTKPPPPPAPLPPQPRRGRCVRAGTAAGGSPYVQVLRDRRLLLNGQPVCASGFGFREAQVVCSTLCTGSFVGLPRPPVTSEAAPKKTRLSCLSASAPLASCTLDGGSCPGGDAALAAGLECLQQGGPAEPPRPTLACSDRGFRVAFRRQDVESSRQLTLGSGLHPGYCNDIALGQNETHVWLEVPYTGCNVTQGYNATHQLYRMQLLVLPAPPDPTPPSKMFVNSPAVYTEPPLLLPLLCALPSGHSLAADPLPVAAPPLPEESGRAAFRTDIGLFGRLGASSDGTALEFSEPLDAPGAPPVQLGQLLYARVRLLGVADSLAVRLRLLDCWATLGDSSGPRFDLLRDRCPADPSRVQLIPVSDRVVGLGFPAFRFADNSGGGSGGGQMRVHCNLSVCNRSDPDCRGCEDRSALMHLRRRRRSLLLLDDDVAASASAIFPSMAAVFIMSFYATVAQLS